MFIKKMLSQNRRDFTAMLECEHCTATQELNSGYDDSYYHQEVLPKIKCKSCGKPAGPKYEPQETKYPESAIV